MKSGRDYLNFRMTQLRERRSSNISNWKDLRDNFSPFRGKFDDSDHNNGSKRNRLSNSTPLFAKRTLRSGLMTGITSPARPWFKLAPPDPEMAEFGPVRAWLDNVQSVMYRVFAASGLYKVLPSVYEECGVFGVGAMMQEEDFENITRFTPYTAGEYMLGVNNKQKVHMFGREYPMSVYDMIEMFGIDKVSTAVRTQYELGNYTDEFKVSHLIEPIGENDVEGLHLPGNFAFRSVYWEPEANEGNAKFLRLKGYYEFPVLAPRWDTVPGNTYSTSPGMDALGDAMALQIQEKEKGKAIARMASPPTTGPGSMKNSQISLLPGAVNFSDNPDNVLRAIYQIDPRINELMMDIRATEDRINRAFYVDLFLMIANDSRNQRASATEIIEKKEEKLLQLGPVLENVNDDLLNPMIDRTFNMLVRASEGAWNGLSSFAVIPPPPPELDGQDLKVEFVSILAQAQKMVSTSAIERWIGFAGSVASLGKPEALDKINTDEVIDQMAIDLGVPNKAALTGDEVAEIRAKRAEEAQAAQATSLAGQAVDGAKSLSQADTTKQNLLTDVLGQISG